MRLRRATLILAASVVFLAGMYAWRLHRAADAPPRAAAVEVVPRRSRPMPVKPLPLMTLSPSEPRRLRIPALGVDAPVLALGKLADGSMQAPSGRDDVGWYKFGYVPGALGNSVMAGHFWHETGRGVFSRLSALHVDDPIAVQTETRQLYFKVVSVRSLDKDASADDVFGPSDTARLNLITCSGDWNPQLKQYANRLVVTAVFVHETE